MMVKEDLLQFHTFHELLHISAVLSVCLDAKSHSELLRVVLCTTVVHTNVSSS